jgi:signal transduction histidine kinase
MKESRVKAKHIKPNLTSQIRHELITPLTCILSLLGSLGRTRISEQQANYLHDIEDSVASLIGIQNKIDQLVQQANDEHN